VLRLLPDAARWSVGSREVDAQSFELSLEAQAFARLLAIAGGRERVKEALADAVATADTILADLHVVLQLHDAGGSWGQAYRSAPRPTWEPRSDADAVLAAAVALLDAQAHAAAARVLERGRLTFAEVSSSDDSPLRRWVVALSPRDLAEALRDDATSEAIRRAVTFAATRAREVVASVELAVVASAG